MRFAGKFIGASAALFVGSMMFLAPAVLTGSGDTRTLPVDTAQAEPDAETLAQIKRLNDADDAWFEAAVDIERHGPTLANLARLKAADNAYFDAAMAMETAREEARQLARIEKADDDWFEAAMLIEFTGGNAGHRAQLEAADSAYFDAVIALERNEQTVVRLAQMRAREKLDEAARVAFSQVDEVVTGSLPRDAAAAEAANPMTARFLGVRDYTGFPAIKVGNSSDPVVTAKDTVETVGAIPPRDAKAEAVDDVTASVSHSGGAMPAPQKAEAPDTVKAPAPAVRARAKRPAEQAQSRKPVRFQDRGPVAKVFRIFVMGIGFLPGQL